MDKWYFTFGVGDVGDTGQPYKGGYLIVEADTLKQAIEKFNRRHPMTKNGLVNCAFWYDQKQWDLVSELHNGFSQESVFGNCWEVI
jgi:hypothetical protein